MKFIESDISIFDLDHTLIRCNVSALFGRYLFKRGFFSFFTSLFLSTVYALHKWHFVSLHTLHALSFRLLFYRQSRACIQQYVKDFFHEFDGFFKEEIVALVHASKKRGERVILQSSSPDFLVKPIAEALGIEHVFSSVYTVDCEGRFFSIEVLDGKGKERRVGESVLCHTTAYSDSILDVPLLEKAQVPVAVNPDNRLFALAMEKEWVVLLT